MVTNLPPECQKLEKEYREAQGLGSKIGALEKYINSIPEHKGTAKLRANLRTKLAKLREELEDRKTRRVGIGGRTPYDIKRAGAAQVTLLGLTQTGKSRLLRALTNAKVEVGDHPYTTLVPTVGMMDYGDIQISIVEAPALMEGVAEGRAWGPQVLALARNSDGLILLLAADQNPKRQLAVLLHELEAAEIYPLREDTPRIEVDLASAGGVKVFCAKSFQGDLSRVPEIVITEGIKNAMVRILDEASEEDVRRAVSARATHKPILIVLTRADLAPLQVIQDFTAKKEDKLRTVIVSTKTGKGLESLREEVFHMLGIIRVYSRRPGQEKPNKPLIMKREAKVSDVAARIHSHFTKNFKYAKVWGPSAKYPGEKVGLDHELKDCDITEIYIG